MLLYLLIVSVFALTTFAWSQYAIHEVRKQRDEDCELLRQVSDNQLFVLRHHLPSAPSAERREVLRRMASIRSTRIC